VINLLALKPEEKITITTEATSCVSSALVSGQTALFSVAAIVKKLAEEDKYQ
jgi:hypothetical protein